MTVAVDPAIQQQFDQNAAARRSAVAEVTGELKARQQEIAERIKADEGKLAALGKRLVESKVDEPAPARRVEDNDISARADAYQEADDDAPAPSPPPVPAPVTRVPADEEEVPSFQWDEDPPASAAAAATLAQPPQPPQPVQPAQPARRARPAVAQDADEDLSDHDWLE